MYRRHNRKQTYNPESYINNSTSKIPYHLGNDNYDGLDQNFGSVTFMDCGIIPETPMPNLLNFGKYEYKNYNNKNNFECPDSVRNGHEKYGIKTLLHQKSKITYPFNNQNKDYTSGSVDNITLPIPITEETYDTLITEEEDIKETYIEPTIEENLSDIENRMSKRENKKKNDIKNTDVTIVNMNNKQELTTPRVEDTTSKLEATDVTVTIHSSEGLVPSIEEVKSLDSKMDTKVSEPKDEYVWPELTVDNVNTTFKVVGDLKEGSKVKIVDNKYLAEENSIFVSVSRYTSGQGRDKIMSFLNHLFLETKKNTILLLTDIRNGIDVDNKVSELENMISNMMIFLHRFDTMRNVYRADTGTHARLGVIRNRFYTFRQSLFRDLAIPKK